MFTGIIELTGKIEEIARTAEGGRVRVRAPEVAGDLAIGASIAVNGCCLTVVERDGEFFSADLSGETLRRTSLAETRPGRVVNLERPLRAGAELGGHFVQGHVDGVARVTRLAAEGENWWLSVLLPESLSPYVAEKGSLAVDGISLTVARITEGVADFAIIPHTYARTNMREIVVGDVVNLECDILAKYVERLLGSRREPAPQRLSLARLIDEGF
ncbi:MAG: riboflavin synthase [Candidatus Acidiferrales bacterium]